jgi:hypothetical protein
VNPGPGELDPVAPRASFFSGAFCLAGSRTDWLWSRTVSRW